MRFAKDAGTLLLWAAFAGVAAYAWQAHYVPCARPIEYKIGTIDPRFGITEAELIRDLERAGGLWSDAAGKALFAYDPKGNVTVNLIYDRRQQITEEAAELNEVIDKTGYVAGTVKAQYSALQGRYNAAQAEYKRQAAAFNETQSAYNERVDYWNDRGGAPPQEYAKLTAQKKALVEQQRTLEAKRQEVNQLADEINALIDKYNLLVDRINEHVEEINNNGLVGTQFEEGVYTSDALGARIDIYQFDSRVSFLRVLAHELGHALGLEHNGGRNSIMNPINQGTTFALTELDIEALRAECKE